MTRGGTALRVVRPALYNANGMKRWTLRILLCLLLGAVTTVAVAWGLAWIAKGDPRASAWAISDRGGVMGDSSGADPAFVGRHRETIHAWIPQGVEADNTVISGFESSGVDLVDIQCHSESRWAAQHAAVRNGWPLRATTATRGSEYVWRNDGWELTEEWGTGTLFANEQRWLAWRPIFPGSLINTLFYGAIWLGLFLGVRRVRIALIKRRLDDGRCPQCGFDLRGHRHEGTQARRHEGQSAGCPECGWARSEPQASEPRP